MSGRDLDDLLAAAGERVAAAGECPPPERFVELYCGRVEEAEAETLREHLASCPACLEAARDARRFLAALAAPEPARRVARPRFGLRRPAAAWLGLAAVLVVTAGAVLLLPRSARSPARLAPPVTKAAWVPPGAPGPEDLLYRDAAASDPEVEASLRAAMVPYVADDFASAERALAGHLAAHPQDQRARFFRGVALLLLGRDGEAETALARVVAMASPALAGEARWYRALALVRLGAHERAAAELGVLAAGSGPRRAAAERLLAELVPAGRP